MKKKILASALVCTIIFGLSGCTSSDKVEETTNQGNNIIAPDTTMNQGNNIITPVTTDDSLINSIQETSINKIKLYDAAGNPLPSTATVEIVAIDSTTTKSSNAAKINKSKKYSVEEDGSVLIAVLNQGNYKILITYNGVTVEAKFVVGETNYQEFASIAIPIIIDTKTGIMTVLDNAVIASLSGTVTDMKLQAIEGAQVSLSGGTITNGSFVIALTDINGAFEVIANLSLSLASQLTGLSVNISAKGYQNKTLTITEILNSVSETGFNIQLNKKVANETYYSENFETVTAKQWTVNKITGDNVKNVWHIHTSSDTGMVNAAYTENLVLLAPNDSSFGKIPAPFGAKCFAYSDNNVESNVSYSNFIGQAAENNDILSGGRSTTDNSAELISPSIDLTAASGPLHLSFKTYWEIESVNPNSSGFDLMRISISTDDGATWNELARLNPMNDPESGALDRAPIPFSTTGFNSAPKWIMQEGITLVDADGTSIYGKNIRIKFLFETVDGLFNGFRGWFIDDITIENGEGSFPLWDEITGGDGEKDETPSKVSKKTRTR